MIWDWLNLSTISGFLTVVTFVIQIFDLVPKYAEFQRRLLLILVGFFSGSLLTAVTGIKIDLGSYGSPLMILMIGCVFSVATFLLLGVTTNNSERKTEYYFIMTGSGAIFFVFLLITGMTYSSPSFSSIQSSDLTFGEKIILADNSEKLGNFERSIAQLESAQFGLLDNDPRFDILRKRIERLNLEQVKRDLGEASNSIREYSGDSPPSPKTAAAPLQPPSNSANSLPTRPRRNRPDFRQQRWKAQA
jgi:hypothetical protein